MKKVIKAANESSSKSYLEGGYTDGYDHLHPYFNSLPSISNFELTGYGVQPEFKYVGSYKEYGPQIKVRVEEENGVYYFWPIISMPECDGESLDFYDSFRYLADKYEEAANIATYLMKYPLDSSKWANSKEEEEEWE